MRDDELNPIIVFLSSYIEMTSEEKDDLNKITIYRSFVKKEILHREGVVLKNVAFVVKGAIRFFYITEDGEEQTVEFAFENTPIGEFNKYMNPGPASGSAEALEDTDLAGVSREHFIGFLGKYPRYYSVISQLLGGALLDLEQRDKLLRIPSSRERYERLCVLRPEVIKRVPLTYIASYLRMALGTLSRVRAGKL